MQKFCFIVVLPRGSSEAQTPGRGAKQLTPSLRLFEKDENQLLQSGAVTNSASDSTLHEAHYDINHSHSSIFLQDQPLIYVEI